MVLDAAERLSDHVYEECEESLRTVVVITDDGWEGVYLRPDLRDAYEPETYDRAVESFRTTELETPEVDPLPLGTRQAAVFAHENAFVLQFRYSDAASILVSVAAEAGPDLLGFIEGCRSLVQNV